MNNDPLFLIESLSDSDEYIKTIFKEGSCYRFYLFLRSIYPNAKAYINNDKTHVATDIHGVLYDIDGVCIESDWNLMSDADHKIASEWSFAKKAYLQVGECPACEEPILTGWHEGSVYGRNDNA